MIAHRFSTIKSAKNILYFESSSNLISATKGTAEYDKIIDKLMQNDYAH